MLNNKKNPLPLIALAQTLGLLIYVSLVAAFMSNLERGNFPEPGAMGIAFMLFLLVFSAAVCGLLVFGYPVVLAFNKKIKEALALLGYTFLYSVIAMILLFLIMFS